MSPILASNDNLIRFSSPPLGLRYHGFSLANVFPSLQFKKSLKSEAKETNFKFKEF